MTVKDFSVAVGCVVAIGGLFTGYGKLQAETTQVKNEVKDVRQEVKETKEDVNENENVNIKQTEMLNNIAKILEKVESKL